MKAHTPRASKGFWFSLLFLLMAGLIAGSAVSLRAHATDQDDESLLNPARKHHKFKMLRPFRPELLEMVSRLEADPGIDEIAVYFRALNDGVWTGVDERARFAPASLLKVPMMLVYLKQAEKDPGLLKKEIVVGDSEDYIQYIPSEVHLEEGKAYTVEKLLEIMIVDSNNAALQVLSENLDATFAKKIYYQFGLGGTFSDAPDFLSLKNYAGIFRTLYNASFLSDEMSEKAMHWLAVSKFDMGIIAGVPKGTVVAHKFGEYLDESRDIKQLHDVGIVYHPDNPYILGIMTRGNDYAKLEGAIRDISAFIYEEVDRQYKNADDPDFNFRFEDED